MAFPKGLFKVGGIILTLLASASLAYAQPDVTYTRGIAIFKLKPTVALLSLAKTDASMTTGLTWLDAVCAKYSVSNIRQVFHPPVNEETLKRWYYLEFPSDQDVMQVINELAGNTDIECAEPSYIFQLYKTPDDLRFAEQWAHKNMQSEQAWDIQTGSEDVVIGIIDTGIDLVHTDLTDGLWVNSDEIPDNGIDDDNNGYIDDVHGYNMCALAPPYEPTDYVVGHGTHCSGIAAGVTNNDEGISGLAGGWYPTKGCRVMAIKCDDADGNLNLIATVSGIVYAADNGAKVLSMSWGGPTSQDVIYEALDYAYNKGCVLVAAAGNTYYSLPSYPAMYDICVAVAATDEFDKAAIFTTYSTWVDVSAPGMSILSTTNDHLYGIKSGTSMACPYVAGLAGLILSQNIALTNEQVRDRILGTVDCITGMQDSRYWGMLGTGRINAYKALSMTAKPVIVFNDARVQTASGSYLPQAKPGPNTMLAWLKNIWINSASVESVLRTDDSYVTIIQPYSNYGSMDKLQINDNTATPYEFAVDGACPPGHKIKFYLDIIAYETIEPPYPVGGYTMTDSFEMEVGTLAYTGFPVYLGGMLRGAPNYGDLNNDGVKEIVVGSTNGNIYAVKHDGSSLLWSYATGGQILTTPALGDIDGDNMPETIIASEDGSLYCIAFDGMKKWSYTTGPTGGASYFEQIRPSPVIADINNDESAEIICMENITETKVVALNNNGTAIWKAPLGAYKISASPAIADVNDDGYKDVIVSIDQENGFIYAISGFNGNVLWSVNLYPGTLIYRRDISMSPVVGDINLDGKNEIVCNIYLDKVTYPEDYWSLTTAISNNGQVLWKVQRQYSRISASPTLVDINYDNYLEVVDVDRKSNIFVCSHEGQIISGNNIIFSRLQFHSTPIIGATADKELKIIVAAPDRRAYNVTSDLSEKYSLYTSGIIKSAPLVMDLNNDKKAEIIVGDDAGYLYAFCTNDSLQYEWPSFRHDQWNTGNYHTGRPLISKSLDATAYNNGRKMVFDDHWLKFHLAYTSNNKILYTTSQDPQSGWELPVCLGDGKYPAIALDYEPQANVVWTNITGEGMIQLCGQRMGESSSTVIKELGSIGFDYNISCSPPSIAIKADTVHLVYLCSRSGGIPPNVLCARSIIYAKWPVGKYAEYQEETIDSWSWDPYGPAPRSPSICIDNKGYVNLAWEKTSTVEEPGEIWWTVRYPGGSWHHKENISNSYAIPSIEPSLYTYGNVHLVWEENGEIYYRECVYQPTPLTDIPDSQYDPYVWGLPANVSQTPEASSLQPVFSDNYLTFMKQIGSDYEVMLYAKQNGSWLPVDDGNISQSPLKNSYYPHLCCYDGIFLHGIWSEGNDWGLGLNAFQKEAPATALYQTNVGDSLPSPYTVQRDGFIAYGSEAKAKTNVVTVDYDTTELIYLVNGLDANKKHTLDINLYQVNSKAEKWQYTILADDNPIQTLWVASATPTRVTKLVPNAATKDGILKIRIVKKKGEIVTCDWWQLFEEKKGSGGAQSAEALPVNGFVNALYQNTPNPCQQTTMINYQLAKAGQVSIKVYNTLGQVVRTLVNQSQIPGYHSVNWDGKDETGRQIAAGVYFYRLTSSEFCGTKKMVMLK